MINLKLAEYNEKGEFERFLELGKHFCYAGDYIIFHNPENQHHFYRTVEPAGVLTSARVALDHPVDEKDPLNRFDGLFDGRTYGDGRFVLVECLKIKDRGDRLISEDDILEKEHEYESPFLVKNLKEYISGYMGGNYFGIYLANHTTSADFANKDDCDLRSKIIGNLHQHPELWSKIK